MKTLKARGANTDKKSPHVIIYGGSMSKMKNTLRQTVKKMAALQITNLLLILSSV